MTHGQRTRLHVHTAAMLFAAIAWSAMARAQDADREVLPDKVSFTRHVLPLLVRHGCSGCHHARGDGPDLGLSLHGARPEQDHERLVRHSQGRLIDLLDPGQSLLLLKGTSVPHAQAAVQRMQLRRPLLQAALQRNRMDRDSFAEQVLRRWIAQGAAGPRAGEGVAVQLDVTPAQIELAAPAGDEIPGASGASASSSRIAVRARFSDGTTSDVSRYASFEWLGTTLAAVDIEGRVQPKSPGRGLLRVRYGDCLVVVPVRVDAKSVVGEQDSQQPAFSPLTSLDRAALAQWRRLGIRPAELAADGLFLRRAYVQLIGRLPAPRDVRRFLGSRDPDSARRSFRS